MFISKCFFLLQCGFRFGNQIKERGYEEAMPRVQDWAHQPQRGGTERLKIAINDQRSEEKHRGLRRFLSCVCIYLCIVYILIS